MEEDIKILEKRNDMLQARIVIALDNPQTKKSYIEKMARERKAIENLIKAYKEQKECLEVTSKALDNIAYDQILIAIKELEENISKEHTLGYSQGVYDCSEAWKETIKEKIEELKERADEDNLDDFIRIQVLEELLGEEK